MSDLVQSVKDGVVQQTTSSTSSTKTTGTSNLDKNSFLQLLTTQMKYQDPLNPNTDTEYVAQLATFSQLEQMQNLSTTMSNSQAFSLVGKEVVVKAKGASGNTSYINGAVDFVNLSAGSAKISVNGSLYSIDQLDSVIDSTYVKEQNLPKVESKVALKYDAANPKNLTFDVNIGSGEYVANKVAIAINDTVVDSNYVTLSGSKVTINKNAFTGLQNGNYKVTVVFNDTDYTTIKDKVTLQVQNSTVTNTVTTNSDTSGTDTKDTVSTSST